ncbi:hypothetical protein F4810DRAFT_678127 [Camillea tinctor]|nr:hypothetical protein F4810DRAFT_678127 [Camillea tinctor]
MTRYLDTLPTPAHVEPKKLVVLSAPRLVFSVPAFPQAAVQLSPAPEILPASCPFPSSFLFTAFRWKKPTTPLGDELKKMPCNTIKRDEKEKIQN